MTGHAAQIVSKLEYAQLKGRTAGAVSHWIKSGRLTPPALVGEGRAARIDVALADSQLATSLSLGHQVGFAIRQAGRDIIVAPETPAPPAQPDIPTELNDQQRLLRARAESAEIAAQEAFAAAQERNGTWVDRAESDREHGRRLAETVSAIERWLPALAQRVAADVPGADPRVLTILFRQEFRSLRATLAREAREQAE